MNYILFDDADRDHLLPLTFTRPCSEIRIGILNVREKWERRLGETCSWLTQPHLAKKYPLSAAEVNTFINGTVCPDNTLLEEVKTLKPGQALMSDKVILAVCIEADKIATLDWETFQGQEILYTKSDSFIKLSRTYDIFKQNGLAIAQDFELITQGRTSAKADASVSIIGEDQVFIEPDAKLSHCIINATDGPVYIGEDAEVMEQSVVRGPFALCEHATLKLATKVYGPTTVGPHSKAGGEVNNSVIMGYSNKGHDGFLGNSVIGEWCNIGADTNNSNLKNNYAEVRLWNYALGRFEKTGLQFCGLIMADHAKCGINTMFNTGTVVGVAANVFGAGFPRNLIPSFAWGGASGFDTFKINKVYEMAEAMMGRRKVEFSDIDKELLSDVFELTASQRYWEQEQAQRK